MRFSAWTSPPARIFYGSSPGVAMARSAHFQRTVHNEKVMISSASAANGLVDPAERRVGRVLSDKWRLDRLLGVGGMAAVYAATHRNGARAAIKLFPFSVTTSAVIAERFLREGYLANKIGHPAVVRVLDDHIDHQNEYAYLVMELLHGQTARQSVERHGTMTPMEALELMIELCDCLEVAHKRGVVHRDIKPENLFITEEGRLKVLDFGVARALDGAHATLTRSGATLGTPAYMSPEQARGRPSDISPRSDIYSVGATLLFLLTGQILHEGENAQEILVKAAWTPAPRAKDVCPELPDDVAVVIDKACAFEPKDRYPDAVTLKKALYGLQDSLRTRDDVISQPRTIALATQTTASDLSADEERGNLTPDTSPRDLTPPEDRLSPGRPMDVTVSLPPPPMRRSVVWGLGIVIAVVAAITGVIVGRPTPEVASSEAAKEPQTQVHAAKQPETVAPAPVTTQTAAQPPTSETPPGTGTAGAATKSLPVGSAASAQSARRPQKSRIQPTNGTWKQSAPQTARTATERTTPAPATTPLGRDVGY